MAESSISCSTFTIDNPVVPDDDDNYVALVDEEQGRVNIYNLTRAEVRTIVRALDPVVSLAFNEQQHQTCSIDGPMGAIDFHVGYYADNDGKVIAINGRYGDGGYCHDFEIEGITQSDWSKIVALLA